MCGNFMPPERSTRNDRIVELVYRDILVPTDRSLGAELALDHAIAIARAFDGTIHILAVDEGPGSVQRDQLRSDSEDIAEETAEKAAAKARANDIPVTTSVQSGTPKQSILSYVGETETDLIVMGTHGREGLKNVIFGSIAEETIRNAPVPVVVVQSDEDEVESTS